MFYGVSLFVCFLIIWHVTFETTKSTLRFILLVKYINGYLCPVVLSFSLFYKPCNIFLWRWTSVQTYLPLFNPSLCVTFHTEKPEVLGMFFFFCVVIKLFTSSRTLNVKPPYLLCRLQVLETSYFIFEYICLGLWRRCWGFIKYSRWIAKRSILTPRE